MSRHFFESEMRCEVRVMLGHEETNGYVLEVMRIDGDLGDARSQFSITRRIASLPSSGGSVSRRARGQEN